MKTLETHKAAILKSGYTGETIRFTGYLQFGQIHDQDDDSIVGYTADRFRKCVEIVNDPNFAYARQKSGYINIYVTDINSPTGVSLKGGIPDEFEYLLYAFGRTGQLSPTEDMRTGK